MLKNTSQDGNLEHTQVAGDSLQAAPGSFEIVQLIVVARFTLKCVDLDPS